MERLYDILIFTFSDENNNQFDDSNRYIDFTGPISNTDI